MSYWSSQSLKTNTHWQSNGKTDFIYADNFVSFLIADGVPYSLPMIFKIAGNAKFPAAIDTTGYIIKADLDLSSYTEGTYLLNDADIEVTTATWSNTRYPVIATNVCGDSVTINEYSRYEPKTYAKDEDIVYNMLIPHIRQFLIVADKKEGKTATECLSDVINKEYKIQDFFHKVKLPKGSEYANRAVTDNYSQYKSFVTYAGGLTYTDGEYMSAGYSSIPKGGGLINPNTAYANACLGFTPGDGVDGIEPYYFNTGIKEVVKADGTPEKLEVCCGDNRAFDSNTDKNYYETDEKYYKLVYDISGYSLKKNVTQIKRRS